MQYYLVYLILAVCCLFVNAQSENNSTIQAIVYNETMLELTSVPTIHPTVSSSRNTTTTISNRSFSSVYVEPPPHPLGYCTRSRLRCSKIRRCCKAPCDVNRMKCP
jgi:hypothetical protein